MPRRRYPGQFSARFESRCPGCDDYVEPLDDAVMMHGAAHCMACAEEEYGPLDDDDDAPRGVSADWGES